MHRPRSALSGRRRRPVVRLAIVLVSLLLVWTSVAGRALVVSRPVTTPDAIVSLASHEWERLPAAAAAAARNPAARVFLTQPTKVSVHNCHDCPNRVPKLVAAGVALSRIRMLQLTVEGTRGEAEACRQQAREAPFHRLLVVTSPYHTRRVLGVFRKAFAGTDVEVGVAPASDYSEARPAVWWTSPYDRWYVAYEWAALFYYAFRYQTWPALDLGAEAAW